MYRIEAAHSKDLKFIAKSASHECVIDAKGQEGLTPPDVLLAALGSCLGVYLRKYGESAKLNLSDFKISVEAEFSDESPMRFKLINVSIDLKDAGLDEPRKRALLEFIKNCPVHNTLKSNPLIEIKLL